MYIYIVRCRLEFYFMCSMLRLYVLKGCYVGVDIVVLVVRHVIRIVSNLKHEKNKTLKTNNNKASKTN